MAQQETKTAMPATGGTEGTLSALGPQSVLKFIVENRKLFAGIMGGILLVMSIYAGYSYYQDYKWNKATDELSAILIRTAGIERLDSLKKFLESAPNGMKPAVRLELALDYERNEMFAEAAQAWKEVAETDEGPLRVTALIARARALKSGGKPAEAVEQYQALLVTAPESYKTNILRQMALSAEAAEMWDKAIEAYTLLINDQETRDTVFFKEKLKMREALKQG